MKRGVILFDGVCNFCNFWVDFIIPRDARGIFKFAALQSDSGRALLEFYGQPTDEMNTLVLIVDDERVLTRSSAALTILKTLGGGWSLLYALMIFPRPIRDAVYDLIARNRYAWFGQKETCRLPTAEERGRFV